MKPRYWHFIRNNRQLGYNDRRTVKAGRTYKVDCEPIFCKQGLHASVEPLDALEYAPGSIICRVELGGKIIHVSDKLVATERRVLWTADATPILRQFGRWCALGVIHLWDAPEVVKQFLITGDDAARGAACDAAGAAARCAARAARTAARGAACTGARGAEWDAAWAARGAAWAARTAARTAACADAWVAARDAAWGAGAAARAAAWGAGAAARAAAGAAARVAARGAGAAARAAAWDAQNHKLHTLLLQLGR
jgi:hypothetical protein